MSVADALFKILDLCHVDIEDFAALDTTDVIMPFQCGVEAIRTIRDFNPADLSFLSQDTQIAKDGAFADIGVINADVFTNFIRRNMPVHLQNRVQNQIFLYRVSSFHRASKRDLFLIDILYYLLSLSSCFVKLMTRKKL